MKLLDKMCKYEMDTASIAKDTILPTDGQTDKVKPVYPPSLSRGIISLLNTHLKNHVSHEQTQPRSCPKVCPYQV